MPNAVPFGSLYHVYCTIVSMITLFLNVILTDTHKDPWSRAWSFFWLGNHPQHISALLLGHFGHGSVPPWPRHGIDTFDGRRQWHHLLLTGIIDQNISVAKAVASLDLDMARQDPNNSCGEFWDIPGDHRSNNSCRPSVLISFSGALNESRPSVLTLPWWWQWVEGGRVVIGDYCCLWFKSCIGEQCCKVSRTSQLHAISPNYKSWKGDNHLSM